MTDLTPETAAALAAHEQFLRLDGLRSLSDEVAAALAQQRGSLGLHGVTTLSDAAAKSLAQHQGTLYLLGLETLSDTAAGVLLASTGARIPARFQARPGVSVDQEPDDLTDHDIGRIKELIDAGRASDAGKLEIESRFRLARPMWNEDGLETLNEAWAEEATDAAEAARLDRVREFSPAWWREMDLRYGIHPPVPESHQDFTVALGLVRTQANVVASRAPGLVSNCRLCHSTMLFTNPDPRNPEPRLAEGIPNAFLDFERFHQNIATSVIRRGKTSHASARKTGHQVGGIGRKNPLLRTRLQEGGVSSERWDRWYRQAVRRVSGVDSRAARWPVLPQGLGRIPCWNRGRSGSAAGSFGLGS